jgi:FkbM family methyltransferase
MAAYQTKSGFWVHDNQKLKWDKHINRKTGEPQYQMPQLEQAIAECKRAGRMHTVIDGGAHVGLWTYHFAQRFQRVLAFEPTVDSFECLRLNNKDKDNVKVYNLALSNYIGTLTMAPRKMGWEHVAEGTPNAIDLPCTTIDSLALNQLDLLKLDIEGHEFEALKGAVQTITRCKPVIVVEDKRDIRPGELPIHYLIDLGMELAHRLKHDHIFVWPEI